MCPICSPYVAHMFRLQPGYIERAGGLALSHAGGQVFRNESWVLVRAGQVFSALENVSRTIVTDPKSSAGASCDIPYCYYFL